MGWMGGVDQHTWVTLGISEEDLWQEVFRKHEHDAWAQIAMRWRRDKEAAELYTYGPVIV